MSKQVLRGWAGQITIDWGILGQRVGEECTITADFLNKCVRKIRFNLAVSSLDFPEHSVFIAPKEVGGRGHEKIEHTFTVKGEDIITIRSEVTTGGVFLGDFYIQSQPLKIGRFG